MSRNNLLVRIAAAVVGVVAIGFAAASVESPVEPGGAGGVGEGEGGGGIEPPPNPVVNTDAVSDVPPFLEYLGLLVLVLVAVSIAWYLVVHRRQLVKIVALYLLVAAVVVVLLWVFMEFGMAEPEPAGPEEPPNVSDPGGDGLGSGENDQRDTFPVSFGPLLLVVGLVAAVFGGAFLLSNRDADTDDGLVAANDRSDDAAAIGAAAGRAADRIDETNDADVDNAVYRAWREMTRHLEVDRPETSTPGEFASAARAAGIEPEHVDELTRLFEEVRYGHADTTREREARAETVLRRIESAYADEDDEWVTGTPDGDEGSGAPGRGENE